MLTDRQRDELVETMIRMGIAERILPGDPRWRRRIHAMFPRINDRELREVCAIIAIATGEYLMRNHPKGSA